MRINQQSSHQCSKSTLNFWIQNKPSYSKRTKFKTNQIQCNLYSFIWFCEWAREEFSVSLHILSEFFLRITLEISGKNCIITLDYIINRKKKQIFQWKKNNNFFRQFLRTCRRSLTIKYRKTEKQLKYWKPNIPNLSCFQKQPYRILLMFETGDTEQIELTKFEWPDNCIILTL